MQLEAVETGAVHAPRAGSGGGHRFRIAALVWMGSLTQGPNRGDEQGGRAADKT
jgi:hypothetical protein